MKEKHMENSDLLAVVSLTHNHPQTIEDVIINSAYYYKKHGVDIYFYDSSDNDETKEIIEKYISLGYDNLTHLSLKGLEMYDKLNMVFSGKGLKKKYKYVWPTKDRAYVKEWVLEQVIEAAEKDYDIIFPFKILYGDNSEYYSAELFYRDYAAWVTSVNVTVYNTKTILRDNTIVDEGYYCKGSEAFLQNAAVFSSLAKLASPRIKIIDTQSDGIMMSLFSSSMNEHSLELWKDNWIKVNDFLPDIYAKYKAKVIKEAPSFSWILGDVNILIELAEQGKINRDNLEWVLQDWERISDIPKETIIEIVDGKYDAEHDVTLVKSNDEMINLIIKLTKMLDDVELEIDIPCNSFFSYSVQKLNGNHVFDLNFKRIILGSIKDILNAIISAKENKEKQIFLQELIVLLSII